MSETTSGQRCPCFATASHTDAASYESARPDNDQLMRRLATAATAFAAAAAVLLVA